VFAIARQLQVTQHEVIKQLLTLGLPRLGRLNTDNLENVIDAVLKKNLPLSVACEAFGMPLEKVTGTLQAGLRPLCTALNEMHGAKAAAPTNTQKRQRRRAKLMPTVFEESSSDLLQKIEQ